MKITRFTGLAAIVLLLALLPACGPGQLFAPKQYEETEFLMDTIVKITAYGQSAEPAVKKALAEYKRIHGLTNQFDEGSQVSQINAMAGKNPVVVDKTLIAMLRLALDNSAKLEGALDVTVGPLTNLWGVGRKGDFVPSPAEIDALLPLVDYQSVEIDETQGTVFLTKPGMRLDLGAISKEYATFRAAQILKENGISSALVNAGGDIRTIGLRPNGQPWRIGVQDPRNPEGVKAKLAMTEWDMMETSGDYQRFFEKDGERYSHILDPHTGRQPRDVISVTVISNSAAGDNYMLATAMFVLGVEKGQKLLRQFPGAEAMWITADNKVIVTPGLEGKLEISQ